MMQSQQKNQMLRQRVVWGTAAVLWCVLVVLYAHAVRQKSSPMRYLSQEEKLIFSLNEISGIQIQLAVRPQANSSGTLKIKVHAETKEAYTDALAKLDTLVVPRGVVWELSGPNLPKVVLSKNSRSTEYLLSDFKAISYLKKGILEKSTAVQVNHASRITLSPEQKSALVKLLEEMEERPKEVSAPSSEKILTTPSVPLPDLAPNFTISIYLKTVGGEIADVQKADIMLINWIWIYDKKYMRLNIQGGPFNGYYLLSEGEQAWKEWLDALKDQP